jgi:hypothetical protein
MFLISIKRLSSALLWLISSISFVLSATSLQAQTCEPPGYFIGAGNGYEWIANGRPTSSSCWTLNGGVSVVSTPGCLYNETTAKQFDMHYGARLSQQFTVPSDITNTRWGLSYLLTMQDPHDDGWWNRLKATLYDVTTGHILAEQIYWGDDPDITCSRRSLTFTGNLAGHTLQVIFADGSAYSDTVFQVRSISLISRF